MSRHVADHERTPEGGRLKNYVDVEKGTGAEGRHTAARKLHERAHARDAGQRMKAFLRIERGQSA